MGKYLIVDTAHGLRFELRARNGSVIAVSNNYKNIDACYEDIELIKQIIENVQIEDTTLEDIVPKPYPKFEIYSKLSHNFQFRLLLDKDSVIISSDTYTSKAACLNGINSVISNVHSKIVQE